MHIAYLANIRLPTEKAHGLQIMQMCEAFASQPDCTLTLYAARRVNTADLENVADVWKYYNVDRTFEIIYVPCIDLFRILPPRLAFIIQTATYLIVLALMHLNPFRQRCADLIYSRDPFTLLLFSLWTPRARLCYEAHQLSKSNWQRRCVRRMGTVIAVTGILADRMRERGARRVNAAHDGFRSARFADPPTQAEARQQFTLPDKALIVGYVGRLHTMGMSKGVETVIDAIGQVIPDPDNPIALLLVGGPDDQAEVLRIRWLGLGLPADHFCYRGSQPAALVPLALAACDICTMPLPWTEHFAYFASSLKLFEYMAANRAIVASDLPSTAEVIQNNRSALLVPPDDPMAMAAALTRLRDDPDLRQKLADQALIDVQGYSWDQRAKNILHAIKNG